MMKFNKEELNLLFDKYDEKLAELFGEDYEYTVEAGFNEYLDTYRPEPFIAPTREYQLEYIFNSWLQDGE